MPLYSPPCWRVRQLQRWAWERVGLEKLLLRCRLLGRAKPFGAHGGVEGQGHIVAAARLQLVECVLCCLLGPLLCCVSLRLYVLSLLVDLVKLSIPVQVSDWKDSSPK